MPLPFCQLPYSEIASRRKIKAIGLLGLILLFLGNILYVAAARTSLVVILAFMILFGLLNLSTKRYLYTTLCALLAAFAIAAFSSSYLRDRVGNVVVELQHFDSTYDPAKSAPESAALRLELWKKSIQFLAQAPLVGHGTGSIGELFRRSSLRQTGLSAFTAQDPHNQTLAVGIQLGLVGVAVLYSMWIAHFQLFRARVGPDRVDWNAGGSPERRRVIVQFSSLQLYSGVAVHFWGRCCRWYGG